MKTTASILILTLFFIHYSLNAQEHEKVSNHEGKGNFLSEWVITHWKGASWENGWRYSYTYANSENPATRTEQDWMNNQWLNMYYYSYTYDALGNMIESVYQKWDEDHWQNDDKKTSTFDKSGNIVTESDFTWFPSISDWLLIKQKNYTYDKNGNITAWIIKVWTEGVMVDRNKIIYFYDENNNMIESIYSKSNDGIVWVNNSRHLGQYDVNNNLIESLSQEWNGTGWTDKIKNNYQYDNRNRQTQESMTGWDGNAWVKINQYKYGYDDYGNKAEHIKLNRGTDDWVNYERYTYEFNGFSQLLVRTYYLWNGADWSFFNIERNSYDENGNLSQTLFQDWKDGSWIDKRLDYFKYIFHTGIEEQINMLADNMLVWPNPTTGLFRVQSSDPIAIGFRVERVEVVDLNGKVLESFTSQPSFSEMSFDIGHLSPGVYVVKILTRNSSYSRLVLLN
jgi:hypothetical protein